MEMVRAILTGKMIRFKFSAVKMAIFLRACARESAELFRLPVIVCAHNRKIWEDYQYGLENTELDQLLKQVSNQIFQVSSPSDIKAMLALQGWCEDGVRLPLVPLSPQEKQALQEFMQQHSLL